MNDTDNTNTQKILPEVGASDIPHDDLGWQEVRDLGLDAVPGDLQDAEDLDGE
ncbi:hypothetical protein RYY46_006530 [Pseudomonas aeruginosa]|nr:hypothetical protein [Pseudomonas aeruginosa]